MSPAALLELEEKTEDLISLSSAKAIVDEIYALDVSAWDDDDFATLEHLIDRGIAIFSAVPNAQFRPLIERLLSAREGVEQGMSPDPAKRPSIDELRDFVSAHL